MIFWKFAPKYYEVVIVWKQKALLIFYLTNIIRKIDILILFEKMRAVGGTVIYKTSARLTGNAYISHFRERREDMKWPD